jgi:putative SOS response-associated peptidase YedK
MCGRFTLTVSASVLADLFRLGEPPEYSPRFNVAPTQQHPIAVAAGDGSRRWLSARWGLVPYWAKDLSIGARMINARSETAASKPSFRSAVQKRRCLVPADGFYEWKRTQHGKQPFHIRFTDRHPFAFAGLWETWRNPDDEQVVTFTIMTTAPNAVAAAVHQRMPCILEPPTWAEWTMARPITAARLAELTAPVAPVGMEAVAVSKKVNSPANDDPSCLDETPYGV